MAFPQNAARKLALAITQHNSGVSITFGESFGVSIENWEEDRCGTVQPSAIPDVRLAKEYEMITVLYREANAEPEAKADERASAIVWAGNMERARRADVALEGLYNIQVQHKPRAVAERRPSQQHITQTTTCEATDRRSWLTIDGKLYVNVDSTLGMRPS